MERGFLINTNWKEGNENRNTVKIISETGSEVGEITLKITPAKTKTVKGFTIRKLLKLKHNHNNDFNTPKSRD